MHPRVLCAPGAFAEAVSAAGSARFDAALLAALRSVAPVDHLTALVLPEGGVLRAVAVASALDRSAARSLTRDFVARRHVEDPILREFLATRRRRRTVLRRHDRARLPSADYAERFFGRAGIVDKLSVLWRDAGGCFYVNLYRDRRSGRFSEAEARAVGATAAMIASLVRLHAGRLAPGDALPRAGGRAAHVPLLLDERLTPREAAVVAGILRGQPAEGIALDLGIAASSVVTFRRRAYAKLGVSGRAELFARALGVAAESVTPAPAAAGRRGQPAPPRR
jgi:DNA-binding CsgD family transcriptional regulator